MKSQRRTTTRRGQPKISISMAVSLVLAGAAQMRAPVAIAADAAAATATATTDATSATATDATSAATATSDAASAATDQDTTALQEVTVTANRRSESVLDVPYNISAVTGTQIENSGAVDLQSLTTMVPGLQAPNAGLRGNQLPQFTIRGLNLSPNGQSSSPGGEAPLVSVYSDDTPLEADLKMTDIQRVEVLRGPQSTLYGSGAVGGTVRLIHNQPDTTQTEFQVTVDSSKTQNAGRPNGSIDTIFNIPFSDSFALRGSAGWQGQSGFTDARSLAVMNSAGQPVLANPADPLDSGLSYRSQNGIDDGTVWYGRLAGLYKFSDSGQATLTFQHQQTFAGDYPYEEPGLEYVQDRDIREPLRNVTDLASLDVSQDLGFATVSSTSSYTNQNQHSVDDLTGLIQNLDALLYGNYPRVTSPIYDHDRIQTLTEELRLASDGTGPMKWVAGMWYSYQYAGTSSVETVPGYAEWTALPGSGSYPGGCTVESATCPYPTFDDVLQNVLDATPPSDPLPGKPADGVFYYDADTHLDDFSPLFGELSYHITPKWQVTGGGRIIMQRFSEDIVQTMPVCGSFCAESPTDATGTIYADTSATFHKNVFKANTSYEIAPDTLLYYTWSQGFRRGGANALPIGTCAICAPASQLTYQPDIAVNNEVGIKGRIANIATYTVTLFNINWEHPQISGSEELSGFGFIANAGSARSRGLESEFAFQAGRYTQISLGYAYTDAELTSGFSIPDASFVGQSGDRLPGVSKQQTSAAVDFESPPVTNDLTLHAHADIAYRSDFWTETPGSANALDLPGYMLVNVRAGVSIRGTWKVDAYVSNVTGSQAISGANYDATFLPHANAYYVSQPRTVGINVNYSLGQPK